MKKKIRGKHIITAAALILVLWTAIGGVDYFRVSNFERPIFCLLDAENSYDDGGSGTYNGLGYSFEIKGNFMPDDELPEVLSGVTQYTYRILGFEVRSGIRD